MALAAMLPRLMTIPAMPAQLTPPPPPTLRHLHTQGEEPLVRHNNQPGIIATAAFVLTELGINIMTVAHGGPGADAIMAIGIDGSPDKQLLGAISCIRTAQGPQP